MGINLHDPRLNKSKWYKWQDMPEGTQSAIFTIESVTIENYAPEGQKEDWKVTLWFYGIEKGFGLNVGNNDQVKLIHGDVENSDEWIGKQIVLAIERTMYEGQMVNCLRVHPVQATPAPVPVPAAPPPAAIPPVPQEPAGYADEQPPPPDDVPF